MGPSDEPEEIVVRLGDDQAIVIGPPSGTKRSRWGRWAADLTTREVTSLLQALDPVMKSFIEARHLTGGLVEVDPASRAMWSTAKVVTEEGGWTQATLRNDLGQVVRLMRIRPATGVAAMTHGAAILGAVAAQAQTAEMARNIEAIRQGVGDLYKHLQSDQIGAVENAVEQVDDLVERLRAHGKDGIEAGEVPVIKNGLGDARRKCLGHLKDAVTRLEDASHGALRQAEKSLSKGAVEEVTLYLDLLAELYAATVQLGLAEIALDYLAGKPDVARTRTERITKSADQFRTEIEDVLGRIGHLDESIRARFRPALERVIRPTPASGAAGIAVHAAVRKRAGTTGIPAIAAAVGGALLPLGIGVADAVVQSSAEKKLDGRLAQLTGVSSRSSETLDQAELSLGVHRTLTEELAAPGE